MRGKNAACALYLYLEVRLSKAARHCNHRSSEGSGHADGGQELRDVWGQPERNGPVGIQITGGIINIEAEVRDVELSCVLLRDLHQITTKAVKTQNLSLLFRKSNLPANVEETLRMWISCGAEPFVSFQ